MNFLTSDAFRNIAMLFASAMSIVMVMLWLNIISLKDVVNILDLRKDTTECQNIEISKECESTAAIYMRSFNCEYQILGSGQKVVNILYELFNRLFEWVEIEYRIEMIKIIQKSECEIMDDVEDLSAEPL